MRLLVSVFVLGLAAATVQAGQIDLKGLGINADFDDYASIGDGVATTGWASVLGSAGGLIANAIPQAGVGNPTVRPGSTASTACSTPKRPRRMTCPPRLTGTSSVL